MRRRQPIHNAGYVLLMSILLVVGAAAMFTTLYSVAGGQ